jgi:two-component system, OmpR family, response regulator
MRVLGISSDMETFSILGINLQEEGFILDKQCCDDLENFAFNDYAIILISLDCKENFNVETLKKARSQTKKPIFVFSRETSEILCAYYLNLGADLFLSLPVPIIETIAHIKAAMRRFEMKPQNDVNERIKIGPIEIKINEYRVIKPNEVTKLTKSESRLLEQFYKQNGYILSRESIMDLLNIESDDLANNAINIFINRLRKKLRHEEYDVIETIRGVGYRLKLDE